MRKKTGIICILSILLVMVLSFQANAAMQASEYINFYEAGIITYPDGELIIDCSINGTGTMDMIGAKTIILQERPTSQDPWDAVKTYSYTDYSNLIAYDAVRLSTNVPYTGIGTYQYRAKVYFYAEKGGYDTREYITDIVVAKN